MAAVGGTEDGDPFEDEIDETPTHITRHETTLPKFLKSAAVVVHPGLVLT